MSDEAFTAQSQQELAQVMLQVCEDPAAREEDNASATDNAVRCLSHSPAVCSRLAVG